jgi:hypothetical protein
MSLSSLLQMIMEWLDECRHWLRGGCVGAEGSAVMDGDWPGEVTKLQLENNSIPITSQSRITLLSLLFSFCMYFDLKTGRFLAVLRKIPSW